jgi:hypothetical protein
LCDFSCFFLAAIQILSFSSCSFSICDFMLTNRRSIPCVQHQLHRHSSSITKKISKIIVTFYKTFNHKTSDPYKIAKGLWRDSLS